MMTEPKCRVCNDQGKIKVGFGNTDLCPACSGGTRVLYLEPEIEQEAGEDVTVRAWTTDGKACISYVVRDTNALMVRTGFEPDLKVAVTQRFTHAAFVRVDREGWMTPDALLDLLALDKAGDLTLLDDHLGGVRSEPTLLTQTLKMAYAAYSEATLLDRALVALKAIASGGGEGAEQSASGATAQAFLDKHKEALHVRA